MDRSALTFDHQEIVYGASYSPDGLNIVTASDYGKVTVWSVETGEKLLSITHGDGEINLPVRSAAYSPDGRRIVTTDAMGIVAKIWDAQSGEFTGSLERVSRVSYSPDGLRMVMIEAHGFRVRDVEEEVILKWVSVSRRPLCS